MWSQIGHQQRQMNIHALRLDHVERMSLEWADAVLSPSKHMLGYFSTRGWRITRSFVLPALIDGAASDHAPRNLPEAHSRKRVWKVTYVGRLQERSGIKVFLEVLAQLSKSRNWTSEDRPSPVVRVFGVNDVMEWTPSSEWLGSQLHGQTLQFPISFHVGLHHSALVSYMREEGVLLVLPSVRGYLSTVLAEAALLHIPTVTFDNGGSREVMDVQPDDEFTFCNETSVACLYDHVYTILSSGSHYAPNLTRALATAGDSWLQWHRAFNRARRQMAKEGSQWRPAQSTPIVTIVELSDADVISADGLLHQVCGDSQALPGEVKSVDQAANLVLLLPAPFEFISSTPPPGNATIARLLAELSDSMEHFRSLGAFTFGVAMDSTSISYASAPTWLLHSRDPRRCERLFPVVARREVLCQAFAVDVHVFPAYQPWVLSDVLAQQGIQLVTHPAVLFQYRSTHSFKYLPPRPDCQPWSIPIDRYKNAFMLDHMHRDVAEDFRDLHFPRTTDQRAYTDFTNAVRAPLIGGRAQGAEWSFHNGSISQWKMGAVDEQGTVYWFTWYPSQHVYGCNESTDFPYPYVDSNSVVHPCDSREGRCCEGANRTSSLIRYTFSEDQTMTARSMMLYMEMEPTQRCGDGVQIRVLFFNTPTSEPELLLLHRLEPVNDQQRSHREAKVVHVSHFQQNSRVDIMVDPLRTDHCDSIHISLQMIE